METSRLGLGLESHYFSWQLDKDDRFQTPEVLLSYTDKGFTGMTQIVITLSQNTSFDHRL